MVRLLAQALAVGPESMTLKHIEELAEAVQLKDLASLMAKNVDQAYSLFNRDRHLAQSLLGLGPGERAMLTNGKVLFQSHLFQVNLLKAWIPCSCCLLPGMG